MRKKLWLVCVSTWIGAVCLLLPLGQVHALSCAEPDPVAEEMERSSIVFMGEAAEVKDNGHLGVFQVETAWKGVEHLQIEVYDNGGWDPYEKGTKYLIFAAEKDGKLSRHLCGRSGIWNAEREAAMKAANLEPLEIEQDMPNEEAYDEEQSKEADETKATEDAESRLASIGAVTLASVLVLLVLLGLWKSKKRM